MEGNGNGSSGDSCVQVKARSSPHCRVNAIWVFYRRYCSRWHFECTSHTLSLHITHSLHFLGQPPWLTLSRTAALAENSLRDGAVVAPASEVRGGGDRKRHRKSISALLVFKIKSFFFLFFCLHFFLAKRNWDVLCY